MRRLKDVGLRTVTLTNSAPATVEQQLRNAGINDLFERAFSVNTVRRFKPAPDPYRHVAKELGVETNGLRMVAAHTWDVVADAGGMRRGVRRTTRKGVVSTRARTKHRRSGSSNDCSPDRRA